jgi:hypothetical protein
MSAVQLNHVRNNAATWLEVTSAVVTMGTNLELTKSHAKVNEGKLIVIFLLMFLNFNLEMKRNESAHLKSIQTHRYRYNKYMHFQITYGVCLINTHAVCYRLFFASARTIQTFMHIRSFYNSEQVVGN